MPGSRGFKRCAHCKEAMLASDGHEACVRCLGESHVPQKCAHCAKLTPRARRERDMRLKLLLCDKALQPSEDQVSEPPAGQRKRSKSPAVMVSKKKRASPTRSLPPPSLSRVGQGHKPGTSGLARQPGKSHQVQSVMPPSRSLSAPALRPAESLTHAERLAPPQVLESLPSAQPQTLAAPQAAPISQDKPAPQSAPDSALADGTGEQHEWARQSAPTVPSRHRRITLLSQLQRARSWLRCRAG